MDLYFCCPCERKIQFKDAKPVEWGFLKQYCLFVCLFATLALEPLLSSVFLRKVMLLET